MNRQTILDNLATEITKAVIEFRNNGRQFDISKIKSKFRSQLAFVEANKMPFNKAKIIAKNVIEEATNNIIERLQKRI